MKSKRIDFARSSSVARWWIFLCLMLVLVPAFAQACHLHPGNLANETKQCSVCQMAHTPLQLVLVVPLAVAFKTPAVLPSVAVLEPRCVLTSFSLFCRPPPQV